MDVQGIVGARIVLLLTLMMAYTLALGYLRWRGHLGLLRTLALPAILLAACSVPEALLTLQGTWGAPTQEADPIIRMFLLRAG